MNKIEYTSSKEKLGILGEISGSNHNVVFQKNSNIRISRRKVGKKRKKV